MSDFNLLLEFNSNGEVCDFELANFSGENPIITKTSSGEKIHYGVFFDREKYLADFDINIHKYNFKLQDGEVIELDMQKARIYKNFINLKESLKKEIKEYKDSCRFIKYKDSEDSTEYDIEIDNISQFISDNIDVAYAAKEEKLDCSFKFYDKKTGDLILNVKSNYGTLEQVVDGISLDAVKCFNLVKFEIQQKLLDKNWEECFKIIGNNNVKGEIDLFGITENGDINCEEAIKKLEELKDNYKSRFIPCLIINGKELVESCSLSS